VGVFGDWSQGSRGAATRRARLSPTHLYGMFGHSAG
jgi:hypothetical protein